MSKLLISSLPGSESFLNPTLEGGPFFGRRERAVEFSLKRDGYAKCKEEEEKEEEKEEEAERGVGESEEKSCPARPAVSLSKAVEKTKPLTR